MRALWQRFMQWLRPQPEPPLSKRIELELRYGHHLPKERRRLKRMLRRAKGLEQQQRIRERRIGTHAGK